MKHITYGDRSVLVGDDAADTLIEYARLIADQHRADTVTLQAIRPDGNTVEASFLLSPSATLMVESTSFDFHPPENEEVIADVRDRIVAITRPVRADVEEPWGADQDVTDMF